LALHLVRALAPGPGEPALRAASITAPTEIAGLTLVAEPGGAGGGSTAVFVEASDDALVFRDLVVLAAAGGDGRSGTSSAQHLGELGFTSLVELDGESGAPGVRALDASCATLAGGRAGSKTCGAEEVSGGRG